MANSFFKKIVLLISVNLIISPLFFLGSESASAFRNENFFNPDQDFQSVMNKGASKLDLAAVHTAQTANVVGSFVDGLSIRVYCAISKFFSRSCEAQQPSTAIVRTVPAPIETNNPVIESRVQVISAPQTVVRVVEGDVTRSFLETRLAQFKAEILAEVPRSTIVRSESNISSRQVDNIYDDMNDRINDAVDGLVDEGRVLELIAQNSSSIAAGPAGFVLQSTGTSTQWVATSSLGISAGVADVNNLSPIEVGFGNSATAASSSAIGFGNIASENSASAFGYSNTASYFFSSAMGYMNNASGVYSSSFGSSNTVSGAYASAFGYGNQASAIESTAVGFSNNVSQLYSTAIGYVNAVSGPQSSAFGFENIITNADSVVAGSSNSTYSPNSTAIGSSNTVSASGGTAVGYGNTSSGPAYATTLGYVNTASGPVSMAIGIMNTASGTYSSAFGYNNNVSVDGASAFGSNIINDIADSLMIGPSNTAKLTILSSGNVGIGTTTPGAKLSIIGNGTTTGKAFAISDSTNVEKFSITDGGDVNMGPSGGAAWPILRRNSATGGLTVTNASAITSTNSLFRVVTSASSELLTVLQNGNVGIGTTTPAAKLDINGGVTSQFGTSTNAMSVSGLTLFKNTEIGNYHRPVAMVMDFAAAPGAAPSAFTDFHGTDISLLGSNANLNAFTRLYAFESTARYAGSNTLGSLYAGYFQSSNTGAGTVNDSTALRLWTQNTGNGTIGTARGLYIQNPNNTGSGTITNNYGIYIEEMSAATTDNFGIYSNASRNYLAGLTTLKHVINATTSQAFVVNQASSPGTDAIAFNINHTTNFYPFRVANAGAYGPIFTSTTNGGDSFTVRKNGTGNGVVTKFINAGTGNTLEAGPSGSPNFVLTSGGNLGIGSTTPSQLLSVGNSFSVSSAGLARASSFVTSGAMYAASVGNFFSYNDNNINFTGTSAMVFNGGGSERMRIDNATGNVGIGTTTAAYRLSIAGDTNITGALRFNGNAGTNGFILQTTGTGAQWVATSSLGIAASQWTTVGNDIRFASGRVAVGTTTFASAALTVATSTASEYTMTYGVKSVLNISGYESTGYAGHFKATAGVDGGTVYGVYAEADPHDIGSTGIGVYGYVAPGENGIGVGGSGATGVSGMGTTDGGYGVYGSALSVNNGTGVYGLASSTSGIGVYGTGLYGVSGNSSSAMGRAGYFNQSDASGYALYATGGRNYIQNSLGVGTSTSLTNTKIKVVMDAVGSTGGYSGVNGYSFVNDGSYGADSYGGYFAANGSANNRNVGVYGEAILSDANAAYGVWGHSFSGTGVYGTSQSVGVHGNAAFGVQGSSNDSNGRAGFFSQSNASGYSLYVTGGRNYIQNNLGIGTTTPSSKLTVVGAAGTASVFNVASSTGVSLFSVDYDGSLWINGDAGQNGYVLRSNGSTAAPTWVATSSLGISSSMNLQALNPIIIGNANSTTTATTSSIFGYGNSQSVNNVNATIVGYLNSMVTGSTNSSMFGYNNTLSGGNSLAVGQGNSSTGGASFAVGYGNTASVGQGIAFGYNNQAKTSTGATSFGHTNEATGSQSQAFGGSNRSFGQQASAFGYNNLAVSLSSSAFGVSNSIQSNGTRASAFGYNNTAYGLNSSSFGYNNTVNSVGSGGSAFGYNNTVSIAAASVFGSDITNTIASSTQIGPSDSAKMTILTSGNVGIGHGTTSPFARLSVVGSGSGDILAISSSTSTNSRLLTFTASGNLGIGTSTPVAIATVVGTDATMVVQNTSSSGYAGMNMHDDTGALTGSFQIGGSGVPGGLAGNMFMGARKNTGSLIFIRGNAATEMGRFDSAGNFQLGTGTATEKLTVFGNARFTAVTSGTYGFDLNLTSNGTLTTASSDMRLKENIETLSASSTLEKLLQLRAAEFDWKSNGVHDLGFIAQEVEEIFPELVFTNPTDGYKGINYSRLPALIVSSIQEIAYRLAELGNLVKTNRVETETICLGETCVTEEQLKNLLENNGGSSTYIPPQPDDNQGGGGSEELPQGDPEPTGPTEPTDPAPADPGTGGGEPAGDAGGDTSGAGDAGGSSGDSSSGSGDAGSSGNSGSDSSGGSSSDGGGSSDGGSSGDGSSV